MGDRLRECERLVLAVEAKAAYDICGSADDANLWSCLTLFEPPCLAMHCSGGG